MITSPENGRVKYVRSLHNKRVRYLEKRYIIEGLRLVRTALEAGYRPALVFFSAEFAATQDGRELLASCATMQATTWEIEPALLRSLSDTVTPQGVLAVIDMPDSATAPAHETDLLLVLDALRDPGNLGTILRTAAATCVDAVLLAEGCADAYAPKVVRAGMGAHLHVPILPGLDWEEITAVVAGKQVLLADASAELTLWDVDWTTPTALIVGSEAHGPGPEALRLAQRRVRLPMAPQVESLNAAIAASVLLYEAQRQRRGLENSRPTATPGAR